MSRFRLSSALVFVTLAACAPAPAPLENLFIPDAPQGLSKQTQKNILHLQEQLAAKPESTDLLFALSHAYLQGVRENADTEFYVKVEELLTRAEDADPNNPEVPFLRGNVAMGRHRFHDALPLGKKATAMSPDTARYYGLLADVQVELGMYAEAEETLQAMADLRPEYAALTRIAYFREIYGDRAGAIEAMESAVNQGTTVIENMAWGFTEIGRLKLGSDLEGALFAYDQALALYPNFAPALAGKSRVLMAQRKIDEAKTVADQAAKLLPLPEYYALLADIAEAQGNTNQRDAYLLAVEKGYDGIAAAGTNVDLERAKFLLDHDRALPTALGLAQKSFDERNTIYTADTLAWALHKNGRSAEAEQYVAQALRTNTGDPLILFHAGMIAKANGKKDDAITRLARVLAEQPTFSFRFAPQAKAALDELR